MKALLENLESKFDFKSIPLVDIIIRAGVDLEKQGKLYRACCPFHQEKTPSFTVYPDTDRWKCFGNCNEPSSGDSIDFLRKRYGFSFKQAVEWIETNFSFGTFNRKILVVEKPKPKPVPPNFVIYWHAMLGHHREYFHSRGFKDDFIDRELWGWNGSRYTLPVWEGEPGNSTCIGVRCRRWEEGPETTPKYIGLTDMNPPTIWGRWYCRNSKTILAFAGELDAARAIQDELPAFSLVNGMRALEQLPYDWPTWFPNSTYLIGIFDKKEEVLGSRLCHQWNMVKGSLLGRTAHWDFGNAKDYCEFRKTNSVEDFQSLLRKQELEWIY